MRTRALLIAAVVATTAAVATPAPAATGGFTDIAGTVGLHETTRTFGSAAADYDGDGNTDLLIVRHNQAPARLMRNDDGVFTEVNAGVFTKRDRHDCAWADADSNGLLDVYCTIGANRGLGTGSNELWLQDPADVFTNQATLWAVSDPLGRGRAVTWLDANQDGLPDLYVANEQPRADGKYAPNRLFINTGTRFVAGGSYKLDKPDGGTCAVQVDWNSDGLDDLFVCGATLHYYQRDATTSTFTERTAAIGHSNTKWLDIELVDWNSDGLDDLAELRGDLLQIRLHQADNTLSPATVSVALTAGRNLAAGDFNGDDADDLWAVQGRKTPTATVNQADTVWIAGEDPVRLGTATGDGDHATILDIDADGDDEVFVTNGYATTFGPHELWSWNA